VVALAVSGFAFADPPAEPPEQVPEQVPDEIVAVPTREELLEAIRAGKPGEAVEMARRLLDATPDEPGARKWVLYNLGCALALDGQADEAVETLGRSVADGWVDWVHFATDPDFDSLRGHAGFKKLVERLGTTQVVDTETPGSEPVRSLLVVLHESGSNEKAHRDVWLELAKATDSRLVAPRAPVSVAPDRFRWVVDPTDFGPAIDRVGRAIGAAGEDVPAARVTIVGVGWRSGDLAYRYALARPDRIARVILIDGRFDRFASRRAARGKIRGGVWFVLGATRVRDVRIPAAAAREGARTLGAEGFTFGQFSVGVTPNPMKAAADRLAVTMRETRSGD